MTHEKIVHTLRKHHQNLEGKAVDYKDPQYLALARQIADEIMAEGLNVVQLTDLEKHLSLETVKQTYVNLIHLAVKLAKAKAIIQSLSGKHISIVMPAYGENIRMMPRGTTDGTHPNGENFIIEKSRQLKWLFDGAKNTYQVFIVDDMSKPDPLTSGDAARKVITDNKVPHFTVLYLKDGVESEKGKEGIVGHALKGVNFPKNTKKAGAVYYGCAKAIEKYGTGENHIVVITDCDLSVDLVQVGNLVQPIVMDNAAAAAGSRRLPESILEIVGSRNLRANAARYFRQLLLPGLLPKDTQCGAKAFSAKALSDAIMADRKVLDFAFDIELLTLVALQNGAEKIVPVAVAWFDSAELTTTDSSVHFRIMEAQREIAVANKTGSGEVFDKLVEVSELLTESEETWLAFLAQLENNARLQEAMQSFDTSILDELKALIQTPAKTA